MARSRLVGVDIGTTMVRAAEVQRQGRGDRLTLIAYAELPLPSGSVEDSEIVSSASVSATLKQLWRQGHFTSREVAIGYGSSRTATREIEVAAMPMHQLRQSLPFQVQDMLPMPVDEAILDFVPWGSSESSGPDKVKGMLVAASKVSVGAYVHAAESAGLSPKVVDLNALALLRAARVSLRPERVVGVVDVGATMTTVAIIVDGAPRLIRMIPDGGANVTTALARHMQMAPHDAEAIKRQYGAVAQVPPEWAPAGVAIADGSRQIVEAVRNTFVYHHANNPGSRIDRVVLTGGGALLPGLAQMLSNAARIAVTYGDPLEGVSVGPKAAKHVIAPVTMAVAMGLATAEAS